MIVDLANSHGGPAAPITAAAAPRFDAPPKPPFDPKASLATVVLPEARDRFTGMILRGTTPESVQSILDGAFAGIVHMQHDLFSLMEDSWPRLKKNLNEVKRAVIMAQWHAEAASRPEAQPTPEAQRRADFLNDALAAFQPAADDDENGFTDMIYDLLDAVGKGISVQEILWESRAQVGTSGPGIVARATRWIPPRYYGYRGLETALRLFPTARESDWIAFPPDKFILGVFKTKTGHPVNTALLRSLASWWISASFSQDWALNLAQMFGLPIRTAEYDPTLGTALKKDICNMLATMGSAAWGAFPLGTKLQLHESAKNAGESPQAFIMKCADTAADLLILGQTLTSNEGKSGSRALGQVHQDVREDVLQFIARWVETRLEQAFVAPLMRLNFGDNVEDPRLRCEIIEAKDQTAMATRDVALLGLGLPVPKKWFYDRHEIPMPGKGDEVFVAPKPTAPSAGQDGGGDDDEDQITARLRRGPAPIQAKDATDKLLDNVLEDLSGVESRWLGGVKPFFTGLVDMAENPEVTDELFLQTLERAVDGAARIFPELFPKLDTAVVEDTLFNSMSAAAVNGVTAGVLSRRPAAVRAAKRARKGDGQ